MTIAVAARNTGLISSAATSWAITLPASGAVTGDVYIVVAQPGAASTMSTSSSGWAALTQGGASGTPIAIFIGVVGTASSTLTIASSASVKGAYAGLRLTGAASTGLSSAFANGSSSTPAAPALTPSGGSQQYLWLVAVADDLGGGGNQPTTSPSGWANFQANSTGSGFASEAAIATAELIATAASESPGNWGSTSFSGAWSTLTLAVPAGAIAAADTGTGSETEAVAATVPGTDTSTGTDAASIRASASDTATATESAALTTQAAETGTATDTATVRVQAAETGTATDTAVPAAQVPAPIDTGTATDSATVGTRQTDTATTTEGAAVTAAVTAADTAAATDTATVALDKPATDTAAATDIATVRVGVPAADTAATTEGATVTVRAADSASVTDTARVRHAGQAVPGRLRLVKVLPRLPQWTGPSY